MKTKKFEVIKLESLDEKVIKEWQTLSERAVNANVFNSYEWFLASKESTKGAKYHFYTAYHNDTLVAIFPMEEYSIYGITVIGTVNKHYMIDTGFLMETYDKDLFKAFFGRILQKENTFLQKIDHKAAAILHELFPTIFLSIMSVNPMLPLTDDPFQNASTSTISQIRRLRRKYAGQISFQMYRDDLEKHFETILNFQKHTSKSLKSMDIFTDEHHRTYYKNLTKYCAKHVMINFLYYEKKPIGYIYSVFWNDTFLGEQIAYHNEYRKMSPGKIMVYELIEYIKEHRFKMLDMGGGITPYKLSFTNDYRFLYNAYYTPNAFILLWWKGINLARRIKQIMRPAKFNYDHKYLFKTFSNER